MIILLQYALMVLFCPKSPKTSFGAREAGLDLKSLIPGNLLF